VTTTRGFFLTDMPCSHEIVQTSLTRLFDTAAAAWSGVSVGSPDIPLGLLERNSGWCCFLGVRPL
jgi:hypothetical protein